MDEQKNVRLLTVSEGCHLPLNKSWPKGRWKAICTIPFVIVQMIPWRRRQFRHEIKNVGQRNILNQLVRLVPLRVLIVIGSICGRCVGRLGSRRGNPGATGRRHGGGVRNQRHSGKSGFNVDIHRRHAIGSGLVLACANSACTGSTTE